jgi:hypothetical protein
MWVCGIPGLDRWRVKASVDECLRRTLADDHRGGRLLCVCLFAHLLTWPSYGGANCCNNICKLGSCGSPSNNAGAKCVTSGGCE